MIRENPNRKYKNDRLFWAKTLLVSIYIHQTNIFWGNWICLKPPGPPLLKECDRRFPVASPAPDPTGWRIKPPSTSHLPMSRLVFWLKYIFLHMTQHKHFLENIPQRSLKHIRYFNLVIQIRQNDSFCRPRIHTIQQIIKNPLGASRHCSWCWNTGREQGTLEGARERLLSGELQGYYYTDEWRTKTKGQREEKPDLYTTG